MPGISPRLLRGAFAVYADERRGTQPTLIAFQYNPEQVRRTLALRAPQPASGGGAHPGTAREDARRAAGPPAETINLSIQLSAIDLLGTPVSSSPPSDAVRDARENGLHAALATLEMLLYPSTATIRSLGDQAAQGRLQINPASVPLVLLVWGRSRVVPVAITSFSVTEEAFDTQLNPIQAKLDLGLKVLTYLELAPDTIGREAYVAYQQRKEQLARVADQQRTDQDYSSMLPQG